MKSYGTSKLILLLSLLVFFQALYSEGFATGTLVATESGLVPIEQLSKQNTIIFPDHNLKANVFSISDTSDYVIDTYLKIGISGESVCVAPDQTFYLFDECIWIAAQELRPFDLLMNYNGNSICHAKGLEWFFDADELGNQIIAKHKGPIGLFIPYKELISCP